MTDLKYTPESEINSRIEKLQAELAKTGCDGAIILQHVDLFYFSGTSQNGHLFVPVAGEPVFMVRKSYERAKEESSIKNIIELNSIKKMTEIIKDAGYTDLKTIGFELDVIPYNTCLFYKKIFNDSDIIDISGPIKKVRLIKSPYEIDLLKHACSVIDEVLGEVPFILKEGMTEIELASLFEGGMRKRGYGGCSKIRAFNQDFFMGNITSGKNGAVPTYFDGPVGGTGVTPANNPHGAGWKKINRDEVVYIDYTCVINGYTGDVARMFVMGGLPDHLKNAHETALFIQKEIMKIAKPSVECQLIYEKALILAEEAGFNNYFMGLGKDRVKFVGHGVGLELDESPVFAGGVKMKLQPGMTFAIEPKFVFPDGAIGIENTFVMREDGMEALTKATQEIVYI